VADTTAPSLTCPANLSAPAIDAAGAAVRYPAPAAADAVTAAPQITVSAASGSVFPPGVTTVTATAKDGAGNQSTCSFKVTVTTTPGVTCPAPVRAVATSAEGALVEFPAPVVTDAAGGSPAVSVSPASGSRFPIGVTQVQVTATNAAGNSASCAFDVTVERPVLTLVHGGCASAGGGGLQALAGALFALWALRRRRAPRQARGWSPGAALPFAALVLAAAPALAGDPVPGFDLERLRLAPAATGSLLVDGGDLLPLGAYRLALTLGLEHGSLLADTSNGQTWPLVRDRLQAWLTGAWTPLRNLEVSAQLPVTAWQNGSAPGLVEGVSAPPKQGLGTPLLGARYALLRREEGAPVSLSLGLDLGLPGGTASAFDGESDWAGLSLFPRVAASGLAGPLLLGASAAVHLRAHQQAPGRAVGNELELAGSASTRGPGLRGELSVEASRSLTASYGAVELLGGVRYPFAPGFEAYALAGKGFTDAPGAPSWRAIAGVAFTHEPPPPPGPCEPGQRHQPEQCPALDDDGDGVPNGADRCPLVPGPADDAGCPKPPPKKEPPPDVDTDGDGVVDRLDKCPAQPGPASNQGCPLPDADGDGVPDAIDNCPREPGPASNQGCPLAQKQLVEISRGQLLVKEKISFANDKVLFKLGAKAIEGEGALLLQQIGKILLAHPEITLLTIAGHTDDTGPAALNRKLSQARADAVRDYLVKQGVEPQRLAAKGYGPDQPLAPNDTAEGRKENRRVEFLLTGGGAGE
jgi:outer membrane protein OmpA-like peptidoglycan-associated protein